MLLINNFMSQTSEELFNSFTKSFVSDPKISQSKMFGSPGLKINGKVFAFLMKGKLILKLPKEKVDELIAANEGKPFGHIFAPNNFRPMKEWVEVLSDDEKVWLKLARKARDFVLSK